MPANRALSFDPRTWWQRLSARVRWFGALVVVVVALAVVFSEGLMTNAMLGGDAWATRMVDDIVQGQTGIVLLGHVYNIDIPARQVDVSWLVLGCGDLKMPNSVVYSAKGYCGLLQGSVDFFVDGDTDPAYSYSIDANPRDKSTGQVIFVQPMQAFTTTHLLVLYAWRGLDQQYGFPFDGYQLGTTISARDSSTNASLPLLGVRPISSTNNFNPALRFDVASEMRDASTNDTVVSRTMEMAFARTGFARTYVMTLFVLNWALAAVCVWITVSACCGQEVTEGILLLPISVILTIPALRALWDGAPAFGLLLDSCGTFLQMVIVAICSIFLIIQIATNKEPDEKDKKQTAPFPPASPDLRGKNNLRPERHDPPTEDEKQLLDNRTVTLSAV